MDKILVVVFDNENKAYEGSRALQELHKEDSIHLYAEAVIVRNADGKVYLKKASDMGPVGRVVGLLAGSLIGLFGGPLGVAVGAGVGLSAGFLYDMAHLGVGQDFLNGIGRSLKPGKAAVVAEVGEEWTLPVDSKMESLGGVVFRCIRRDGLDRQVEWDITRLKAEIDELEIEHNRASGEAKTRLQEKIDTARVKLQTTVNRSQARLEASLAETKAKIQSLHEQAAKARGERKVQLEKWIAELTAEQERRSEQLKQNSENIKETLET